MTKEEINARLDALGAIAQERREQASDTMRGLLPANVDWLEPTELEEHSRLQLELVALRDPSESREAARARVDLKRAARRASASIRIDTEDRPFGTHLGELHAFDDGGDPRVMFDCGVCGKSRPHPGYHFPKKAT